jgi:hypothetical protein
MPDFIDYAFREPPGPMPPEPSPWAQMPLWRVLAWDAFWIAALIQFVAWPVRPRTAAGVAMAVGIVAMATIPFSLLRRRYPNALFDNPIALRVKARTAHEPGVSGRRLGYLLGAMAVQVVVVGALLGLLALIRPAVAPYLPPHIR